MTAPAGVREVFRSRFGGSVLALVREDAADPVRAAVADAFARRCWTAPEFLAIASSDGARRAGLQ